MRKREKTPAIKFDSHNY